MVFVLFFKCRFLLLFLRWISLNLTCASLLFRRVVLHRHWWRPEIVFWLDYFKFCFTGKFKILLISFFVFDLWWFICALLFNLRVFLVFLTANAIICLLLSGRFVYLIRFWLSPIFFIFLSLGRRWIFRGRSIFIIHIVLEVVILSICLPLFFLNWFLRIKSKLWDVFRFLSVLWQLSFIFIEYNWLCWL